MILVLALATAGVTLITFTFTTLINEPASIVTLVLIVAPQPRARPGLVVAPPGRRRHGRLTAS